MHLHSVSDVFQFTVYRTHFTSPIPNTHTKNLSKSCRCKDSKLSSLIYIYTNQFHHEITLLYSATRVALQACHTMCKSNKLNRNAENIK